MKEVWEEFGPGISTKCLTQNSSGGKNTCRDEKIILILFCAQFPVLISPHRSFWSNKFGDTLFVLTLGRILPRVQPSKVRVNYVGWLNSKKNSSEASTQKACHQIHRIGRIGAGRLRQKTARKIIILFFFFIQTNFFHPDKFCVRHFVLMPRPNSSQTFFTYSSCYLL